MQVPSARNGIGIENDIDFRDTEISVDDPDRDDNKSLVKLIHLNDLFRKMPLNQVVRVHIRSKHYTIIARYIATYQQFNIAFR